MPEPTMSSRLTSEARTPLKLGNENGSLVLALLVTVMVGGLMTVLLATVISGQSSVRFDQEFTGALHVAEAGVEEVLYRLNAGQEPDEGTGELDAGTFGWEATQLDEITWEVVSSGEWAEDGVRRTIRATIGTTPLFDLAAFSDNLVSYVGANTADSYNSNPGDEDWCTGRGRVGSNNQMNFQGVASGECTVHDENGDPVQRATVDGVDLYDWAGNPGSHRCSHSGGKPNNCWVDNAETEPRFLTHDDPVDYVEEAPWVQDAVDTCVNDVAYDTDHLQAGSDFGYTIAPAGPGDGPLISELGSSVHVYCAASMTFNGHTTLAGATPDNPVVFVVTESVSVTGNMTVVNCDGCTGGGGGWSPHGSFYPRAGSLQIYTLSDENTQAPTDDVIDIGNHARIAAAIYAPLGTCGGSAQAHIFGSMICWDMSNVGGWNFHYDEALGGALHTGQYGVRSWSEEL